MSESINRFIPVGDVRDAREVIVDAPATLVLEVAEQFDIGTIPIVNLLIWLRAKIFGVPHTPFRGRFIEQMQKIGWCVLAAVEHRELVMGAVAQPWVGDTKFRPVAPEKFVEFNEPDLVKIAWTIQAEPMAADITRLRMQTRVSATDKEARRKFAVYWSRYSPGIRWIRRSMLRAFKREAERRFKAQAAGISTPAPQTH